MYRIKLIFWSRMFIIFALYSIVQWILVFPHINNNAPDINSGGTMFVVILAATVSLWAAFCLVRTLICFVNKK